MYDTVNMIITKAEVGSVDFMSAIPPLLDSASVCEHRYSNGNVTVSGDYSAGFGALKVSVDRFRVRVSGSLPKWYSGGNVTPMPRESVKWAIILLSEGFGFAMDKAKITRLDVGAVLPLSSPPRFYYRKLGRLRRMRRSEVGDSLYYTQRDEVVNFYDKIRELKTHGKTAIIGDGEVRPIDELPPNLMRYELRYISRVGSRVNSPDVVLGDLCDREFFGKMITNLENCYNDIDKINKVELSMKKLRSVKSLNDYALLKVFEDMGGKASALTMFEEMRAKGDISSKQLVDFKKKVNLVYDKAMPAGGEDELITELDDRMKFFISDARDTLLD